MKHRGFSLLEIVVYVAIVATTLTLVVNVCLTLGRSYKDLRSAKDIQSSVAVGLETLVREIRNAKSVVVAGSTFGTNPSRLTLSTSYNNAASTVEFYVVGSRLMMDRDGVTVGPLTALSTSVTSFTLRYLSTSTIQAVKIELTLQNTFGSTTRAEHFFDTIVVRGSYK